MFFPMLTGIEISNDTRQVILGAVKDLVCDLLKYDRKDDEDLPQGRIEEAVRQGITSHEELVQCFSDELAKWL